jgi:4-amino-4-deoxychorismate lyase
MCLLFETIQIINGNPLHLHYHAERMQRSVKDLFAVSKKFDLKKAINQEQYPAEICKCKITYSLDIIKVEFLPYVRRQINMFKIIKDNSIEYSYKFNNREHIDKLYAQKDPADEIIIVKNDFITDTSIGNLVFVQGENHYTPSKPLLLGTHRARLIENRKITPAHIRTDEIRKYDSFYVINAMTDVAHNPVYRIEQIIF